MTILQKDYTIEIIPGSPGTPGSPGSPAVPAYTSTERYTVSNPGYLPSGPSPQAPVPQTVEAGWY
jgi:hypothetical protein